MKRTTLAIAALTLAFAGCNTCSTWKPSFLGNFKSCLSSPTNVGAPCDAGCESAQGGGCQSCSESSKYGGYGETVIGSYETPMSSGVSSYDGGISIGSTIPSSSIPSGSNILPGSTMPSSSPTPLRGETIRPKPAN